MALDPQDPQQGEKNPVKNPSQEHYDDLFDFEKAEQATHDQGDAPVRDSGVDNSDDGGSSVRLIKPEEGDDEKSGLMKYEQGEGEPKGRLGRFRQKAANSKLLNGSGGSKVRRRVFIALFGASGIGVLVAVFVVGFMLLSGFNVGHIAETLRNARFAGIHYANFRRMGQLQTQVAIQEATGAEARAVRGLERSTLYDKFKRYDSGKILQELGQENKFVVFADQTDFGTGKSVTRVRVGDELLDVPQRSRINFIRNYRQEKEFVRKFEVELNKLDALKGKSRYFRMRAGDDMLRAAGVELSRWAEAGRKIRSYKDAIKSRYDKLKKSDGVTSSIDDVKRAADEIDDSVDEVIEESGDSGVRVLREGGDEGVETIADRATKKALEKSASKVKRVARGASVLALTATGYCMGNDFVDNITEKNQARDEGFKRNAALLLSTQDQYKSGDVTAEAITQEAKLLDGGTETAAYANGIGANISNITPDFDEGELPYQSGDGVIYNLFSAISFPDTPGLGTAIDTTCGAITSTAGQITLSAIEAFASVVSGSSTGVAAQGFKQAVVKGFSSSAGRRLFAKRILADATLVVAIDLLVEQLVKEGSGVDNAGLGDGKDNVARADVGMKMLAGEEALYMGGRSLTPVESAQLRNITTQQRIAMQKDEPIYKRFAASNPYSPTAQFLASIPITSRRMNEKSTGFISSIFNPLASITGSAQKLAQARAGDSGVAYAVSENSNMYGFPDIGFSASELEKMLEEDYFPYQNSAWVANNGGEEAFTDIEECLTGGMLGFMGNQDDCSPDKMGTDRAFRYRLYKMDEATLDMGLEIQEGPQSNASQQTTPSISAGGDTSNVQCAPGTRDYDTDGIRTGYQDGQPVTIRVCGIPGITQVNGPLIALVNSTVSQNFQDLATAATNAGFPLKMNGEYSSFRTMEQQTYLCESNASSCAAGFTAQPGTSNHQTGFAVDFNLDGNPNDSQYCTAAKASGARCEPPNDSPTWRWLRDNAPGYGINQLQFEYWHWGTEE